MAASIPSLMNDGGIALQLLQQAAEARDAARSGKPLRGYDSNSSSKTSDSVEALGRIIEDIDDTKEVGFKTPAGYPKLGIPAEVTDLRALASELNRRQHKDFVFEFQGYVEEAKRGVEDALKNIEYAEMDYQATNGELDGRADAAKGLDEAKRGLEEAEKSLGRLRDPNQNALEGSQIRAFIIVGDQIAGTVLNQGLIGQAAGIGTFFNAGELLNSLNMQAGRDKADAVIDALTKLLGKKGLVVDVG